MNYDDKVYHKISKHLLYLLEVRCGDLRKTAIRGEKRTKGEDYERK